MKSTLVFHMLLSLFSVFVNYYVPTFYCRRENHLSKSNHLLFRRSTAASGHPFSFPPYLIYVLFISLYLSYVVM